MVWGYRHHHRVFFFIIVVHNVVIVATSISIHSDDTEGVFNQNAKPTPTMNHKYAITHSGADCYITPQFFSSPA